MRGPSEDRGAISPQTVAGAGLLVAVAGLILAGVAGPPYLSSDGVNGWIVVFAAGLFASLVAVPFGVEARLRSRYPDRDARWDRAVPVWGGSASSCWWPGRSSEPAEASRATRWPAQPGCWRWSRAGSWWSRRSPCSSRAR